MTTPDAIYTGGVVLSVDPANRQAQALAVRGGTVYP